MSDLVSVSKNLQESCHAVCVIRNHLNVAGLCN